MPAAVRHDTMPLASTLISAAIWFYPRTILGQQCSQRGDLAFIRVTTSGRELRVTASRANADGLKLIATTTAQHRKCNQEKYAARDEEPK